MIQVLADYDTMKASYNSQFANIYLLEFFKDQYIVVRMGVNGSDVTTSYNITLRASLEFLLGSVFIFKMSYVVNGGHPTRAILYKGPPFYFQYKNCLPMMLSFELLSDSIFLYMM